MRKSAAGVLFLITAALFLTTAGILFLKGNPRLRDIWAEKTGTEKTEQTRYTATFLDVFDTRTEIMGYGNSEEEFLEQAELLKEKLWYYHRLFDIYNEYEGIQNVKTINDQAGKAPVKVEPEMIEFLKFCKDMYGRTEAQTNIAMGSVLSIWHDYREYGVENPESASLPSMAELTEANGHTDFDHVIIDEEAGTVFLEDESMSLDVGGIGKGYAVEKTAQYARELGMEHLLMSVGGNVCAVGGKMDGTDWKVGIQNPDMEAEEKYIEKVLIRDVSVVTSGNYQRYYTVDGKRYCHIIDPDTLMPAEYAASVTIIAADSGLADAMSTAVYNMPLDEGMDFVNSMGELEAMWVLEDGTVYYSEHFHDYMEK